MRRIKKSGKQTLVKLVAGIIAIGVCPFAAKKVQENTGNFNMIMSSVAETADENVIILEAKSPHTLYMSDSPLVLYTPEITERLPSLDAHKMNSQYTVIPEEDFLEDTHRNDSVLWEDRINTEKKPEAIVLTQNITGEYEDLSVFNNSDGQIVKTTYTSNRGPNYLNLNLAGQVRNATDIPNEQVLEEIKKAPDIHLELSGEPEVLIMHTHTTESFQPEERDFYDENYTSRSTDPSKNIVAVGARIAEKLAENGITVIHDGTMHDSPYSGAYERSAKTVSAILEAYPSIKVVLDIHRDAIVEPDGTLVAAVTGSEEKDAAQVMIIAGADDGTYDHPNYLENLRLAALLQEQMEFDTPGITRPVLFQYCEYNQDLSTGSLLIEVGAHGNTLEQALNAADLIGVSISKALLTLH